MKILTTILLLTGVTMPTFAKPQTSTVPNAAQLRKMIARFAPTDLKVDTGKLSAGDQKALVKLIQASRIFDDIFMDQLWSKNRATYAQIKKDQSTIGRERRHYYWINKGPWSDLDEHKAFISNAPARKPEGANFYPEDMTKDEFESWVKILPDDPKQTATGFFTVIRRDANHKLTIVPYSEAYNADLQKCAQLLKEAATATENTTLKDFLNKRADAFLSNDYYESDLSWMDLDAPLDITIGPYETYNDELFGYKAAFEAYVNLRDEEETARLSFFAKHLQEIENQLPVDPKYRNPKLGAAAPIRVVNQIFGAGDGNHGVQTAAYNLPNDERVITQKGAKRVMLKNVQEAKFRTILQPIAKVLLSPEANKDLDFEWFFTHIVAHELTHGLGPHQITVSGRQTSPRQELKQLYSAIEEAKADVTGLLALQTLMDSGQTEGKLPSGADAERKLYTTFLASSFRTLRFGLNEAHAKGMALQFNYLMDKGGFRQDPSGHFSVDFTKIKGAVRDLDHDLLTLEAEGNYAGAKKMLDELSVIRPEVQRALDKLTDVPVDIEPKFVTADQLAPAK